MISFVDDRVEIDPGPATDDMKRHLHAPTSQDVHHVIRQLSTMRWMFEEGRPCRRNIDQTIEILHGLHARLVCLAAKVPKRKRRRS